MKRTLPAAIAAALVMFSLAGLYTGVLARDNDATRGDDDRHLHAASATVVSAYAVVHVVNHLAALGGLAAHIAFRMPIPLAGAFYPVDIPDAYQATVGPAQ